MTVDFPAQYNVLFCRGSSNIEKLITVPCLHLSPVVSICERTAFLERIASLDEGQQIGLIQHNTEDQMSK